MNLRAQGPDHTALNDAADSRFYSTSFFDCAPLFIESLRSDRHGRR